MQRRLRESLDDAGSVDRNQRLIWTWDAFSLALCLVNLLPGALVRNRSLRFVSERVRVRTEGRRLEGPFGDEGELHAALRDAPWVTLDFELVA